MFGIGIIRHTFIIISKLCSGSVEKLIANLLTRWLKHLHEAFSQNTLPEFITLFFIAASRKLQGIVCYFIYFMG